MIELRSHALTSRAVPSHAEALAAHGYRAATVRRAFGLAAGLLPVLADDGSCSDRGTPVVDAASWLAAKYIRAGHRPLAAVFVMHLRWPGQPGRDEVSGFLVGAGDPRGIHLERR